MQEEEEATLLVLGCLTGGLGVLVLVALRRRHWYLTYICKCRG